MTSLHGQAFRDYERFSNRPFVKHFSRAQNVYHYGKKLYSNFIMPPHRHARYRPSPSHPYSHNNAAHLFSTPQSNLRAPHGSHRSSIGSSSHHGYHVVHAPLAVTNAEEGLVGRAAVKRGKTSVKQKKGRLSKVHPSKKFKASVEKVLENKKIHATYSARFTGLAMGLKHMSANRALVCQGFDVKIATATPQTSSTPPSPWSFTTDHFLDVASCCFNEKTVTNTAANLANQLATGNFSFQTTQFTVKSCYTTYEIKNATPRTVTLRVYLCAPKHPLTYNPTALTPPTDTTAQYPVYTGGANNIDQETPDSPFQCFEQSQVVDNATDRITFTSEVSIGTGDTAFGLCGLDLSPNDLPTFRQAYKTAFTEIILGPGQSHLYHIQGPSNLDMDFAKLQRGTETMNIQKYSRCPLVMQVLDMVGATTATGEIFGTRAIPVATSTASYNSGVVAERHDHYSICMPEQASGITSITLGSIGNTLQNRRRYHVKAQFSHGTAFLAGVVVADQTGMADNAQPI